MKLKFTLLFTVVFLLNNLVAQEEIVFEHSFWQWVNNSTISDKKLNDIAPHFPFPKDVQFDKEQYDFAVLKWQKLYCEEYEELINSEELIALNPYYEEYIDVVQLPYFIRPLSSYEKPERQNTGNEFEDELNYELDLQAWYFVFHPNEFYEIYKIDFEFPEWFDVNHYRQQIIDKIEASKDQVE